MSDLVPEVGWGVAFLAGLASFLSPCVAPIVPGYLAYVAGDSARPIGLAGSARVVMSTALFVLGFTFVFVALGVSAGLLGGLLDEYRRPLNRVAGLVMVLMGLVLVGFGPKVFKSDSRFQLKRETFGPAGPVVLGMAFGFGWTPCIGPILASILFYAGSSETAGQAGVLLAIYSLGLGIPFLLVGLGVSRMMGAWRAIRRLTGPINVVSGVMLAGIGLLFLFDRFFYVSLAIQRFSSLLQSGGFRLG